MQEEGASEASSVLATARQGAEVRGRDWSWVEPSIWTERMLSALENGVQGGKWASRHWPNTFFAEQGLFTLVTAYAQVRQSR